MGHRIDHAIPLGLPNHLPPQLPQPRNPRALQHSPQRGGLPPVPSRSLHPPFRPISGHSSQRFPRQDPLGPFPYQRGLAEPSRHPVRVVPERPGPTTPHLASPGQLFMLATDTTGLVVRLLTRHRTQNPGVEPAIIHPQINVTSERRHVLKACSISELEEVLQLAGMTSQPIEMPHHQSIHHPGLDIRKQLLIRRTRFA